MLPTPRSPDGEADKQDAFDLLRKSPLVQHAGAWIMTAMLARFGVYDVVGDVAVGRVDQHAARVGLDATIATFAIGETSLEGVRRLATPTAGLLLQTPSVPSPDTLRSLMDDLSVDLGAGAAQTATLTGPTGSGMAVLGDLILKQGEKTGTSLSKLRSVAVGGKLMVSTGGANDTLQFDNLSVFGATSIATGAGADGLSVETLGLAGQSIFGGLVKIGLGEDGDTATFGNSNVNDVVNFTFPATLDAGPGTDTVLFTGRGNVGTLTASNVP